jgi:hypothetical protein
MADPRDPRDRDPLDAWLNAEVELLTPRPGTFERIRHTARRRKTGRAIMSAAGVVIVIAAAVTVPQISSSIFQSHNARRAAVAAGPASPPQTPAPVSGTEKPYVKFSSALPTSSPASLSPGGTSGAPVPPNFQPTSVTFIGQNTGAVIGQAGTPGHCGPPNPDDCTSLAATSDYGTTWYGVSAPVTGAPDGSSGVSQLRFLNAHDGWAFGPELWVTHDGGASWTREQTHGMRVTALETAGDRAFAVFASCAGTGADYAAGCSSFALYSSQAESNAWHPVPGPPGGSLRPLVPAASSASASLVLAGTAGGTGYLLAPSGELLRGPLTGAAWTVVSPLVAGSQVQCLPGAPGPGGQPAGSLLAANADKLVLVCTGAINRAADMQTKLVVESTDGGARWSTAGAAPRIGIARSFAIQAQDNLMVMATDAGIYRSGDGGKSWHRAQPGPGGAATGKRGFSYVGMTSPMNGVALPADASLDEVFITTNGGVSWVAHPVR